MPQTKNALIRYKTLDKCLQNRQRKWTLNDLIQACSDALYELEGRDTNLSKRTIQLDIQIMRSDKLGYNAPIEVYDRKYYRYSDEDFTITDVPLNESDMNVLTETVDLLKQFQSFSLFDELGGIIQKLEDKIYTEKTNKSSIVHLDTNEDLKGLEHIELIYQGILKKICLRILYRSFKARNASELIIHPLLLKEFNNRWFLLGLVDSNTKKITLALDRIETIDFDLDTSYTQIGFNGDEYYFNTIGVTVLGDNSLMKSILKIDRYNAPYVLTKPFHHSQKLIERRNDGSVIIELFVHLNYEYERLILGFGEGIEVIQPRLLRNRIKYKLLKASQNYENKESKTVS